MSLDYTNIIFHQRFKQLRNNEKLSQLELASALSLSEQTIKNYERGNRVPDASILLIISKFFKVSADYLLGISDIPSLDTDIQGVCKYTGLSEKAINEIRCFAECDSDYAKILSDFIENNGIELLDILSKFQKEVNHGKRKAKLP